MTDATVDGRLARGERTRAAVLERAADVASVDGLDGLSIGRLAADLSISKAGVFAHFGSKEELQLATIAAAADRFAEAVAVPASSAPAGLARLVAIYDGWLDYSRRRVFPGGCFFGCTFAEFHAKPGRVRDELAAVRRRWLGAAAALVADARDRGDLVAECDPDAVAFELDALGMAANLHDLLCDDPTAYDRARAAIRARLHELSTDPHAALD